MRSGVAARHLSLASLALGLLPFLRGTSNLVAICCPQSSNSDYYWTYSPISFKSSTSCLTIKNITIQLNLTLYSNYLYF